MAKAVINLQKESGGIVKISPADGTGITEVTVPESGNLVSVDTVVTDNAIPRYDGTIGKLQNSGVVINDSGSLLLTLGTGALGYGAGAGGEVTQLTSKDTAVTLNKPSGVILTSPSPLSAGASIAFTLNNSLLTGQDTVILNVVYNTTFKAEVIYIYYGICSIRLTNISANTSSDHVYINFNIIKGSHV